MEIIQRFLEGMTRGPFKNLLELLGLAPERLIAALVFLGALMVLNDLLRTSLMVEMTRSVVNHMIIDVLTLWPGFLLGFVLLLAGARHPERAWINLGLAFVLYLGWYLGGTLTRLSRRDTEGADLGWMSHGAIITLACGLVARLVF